MRWIKTILIHLCSVIKRDPSSKIVFYHDVGTRYTRMGTPRELFWRHMEILKACNVRFNVEHRVCFDDGFRGIWDEREKFREEGIRPTVFLAVRLVGQDGYLDWFEIRELQTKYGFRFESHTWSHQTLVGPMIAESPIEERTEKWYVRELVKSRERLSLELGVDVHELCFPVGYFSDEVIARCKDAGYVKVYASYPGNAEGRYVCPRCLTQFSSGREFLAILMGGMRILQAWYKRQHKF